MLQWILLSFIGITSGIMVAAGLFSFFTLVQVLERLAVRTNTNKYIMLYEDMVLYGAVYGNLLSVSYARIPAGNFFAIIFGLFTGIFVGCLSMALAEVLNVIPVFSRRAKLKYGMPFIVVCFAIGKCIGSLYQLLIE